LAGGLLQGTATAQTLDSPDAAAPRPPLSLAGLKQLSACELEALFAAASAGAQPNGKVRGHVLMMPGKRCPPLATRTANLTWKGKVFEPDGAFVNQWLGFRAVRSHAVYGPSAYDGQPALIMEYAPGTPLLGNIRDEIREVAPGLYLGRLYERCPCLRFLGYFVLQACYH
jgi:hypothetical protein